MSQIGFVSETVYLNNNLVWNSFDGLSKENMHQSTEQTNSMIFIFGHILMSRYFFASEIDAEQTFKYEHLFSYQTEFNRDIEYPPFEELYHLFTDIGQLLSTKVIELTDTFLGSHSKRTFPTRGGSNLAKLIFLSQHESYHVGQLGILRKQLGFPATSFHPQEQK
jgi:uncharacterized damage-inducible protein DinB